MTSETESAAKPFPLPDGYTVRPLTFDDAEALTDMMNASVRAQGDDDVHQPDDIRSDWKYPGFDLGTSSQVVLTADGAFAGFVLVRDTGKPPVHPWISWDIHPDYHGLGIEQYLFQWGEQRAQQAIVRCPDEARVSYICGTKMGVTYRENLYKQLELKEVRRFYHMLIAMDDAPPEPNLPDGFSFRAYQHPAELEKLVLAQRDSFQDHWGYVMQSLEDEIKEWRHWIEDDKLFDESLFFLAIDDSNGEIAGMSLCRIEEWENPTISYVDTLGVCRAYRRRGLGLALLLHSFGEFWRRGRKKVSLGVDATSLTGALRLYERAGMHADRTWVSYEKELRPGKELATTSVEN